MTVCLNFKAIRYLAGFGQMSCQDGIAQMCCFGSAEKYHCRCLHDVMHANHLCPPHPPPSPPSPTTVLLDLSALLMCGCAGPHTRLLLRHWERVLSQRGRHPSQPEPTRSKGSSHLTCTCSQSSDDPSACSSVPRPSWHISNR